MSFFCAFGEVAALPDECCQLFRGNANIDCGATDVAANGDRPGIRLDLLGMSNWARREEAHAQRSNEGQAVFMSDAHFGFDEQSELVVAPPVMVVPVTLPPTATPP